MPKQWKYTDSEPLGMTVDEVLNVAEKMHPDKTRAELKAQLMSGEGIEVKMGPVLRTLRKLFESLLESNPKETG